MKTYTIATTAEGVLLATVPDGENIEAAIEAEADRASVSVEELGELTVTEGLVLTDDPEADAEVVYSGFDLGRLADEKGEEFRYAVRSLASAT